MFFRKHKTVGNDNQPLPAEPTLIGPDSIVDGNIETAGELRIVGSVRGYVRAGTCIIEAGGTVDGQVVATEVIVQGRVNGPVQATHVHLQNGAQVEGDITSDTIAIDTGARLSGAVWHTNRHDDRSLFTSQRDELSAPFSNSLWGNSQDDDFRPIKAVKPRASNGSGR